MMFSCCATTLCYYLMEYIYSMVKKREKTTRPHNNSQLPQITHFTVTAPSILCFYCTFWYIIFHFHSNNNHRHITQATQYQTHLCLITSYIVTSSSSECEARVCFILKNTFRNISSLLYICYSTLSKYIQNNNPIPHSRPFLHPIYATITIIHSSYTFFIVQNCSFAIMTWTLNHQCFNVTTLSTTVVYNFSKDRYMNVTCLFIMSHTKKWVPSAQTFHRL